MIATFLPVLFAGFFDDFIRSIQNIVANEPLNIPD